MKRFGTLIIITLFLGMALMPLFAGNTATAKPGPQPQPCASWVMANESWMSMDWFDAADGDDITVNAGGIVHLTWNWTGADGSRDISGIVVNAGGIFIQHNGTRLDINTATSITVNEGGQWRSLGTFGSRCTIKGESTVSATHLIDGPGKLYFDYTDIDTFLMIRVSVAGGASTVLFEMHNSTVTDVQYCILGYRGTKALLVNCTIASTTATRYCFSASNGGSLKAINCAFTSVTDNYLANSLISLLCEFYGCTFQGVPIESDDFLYTLCDYDIRIYEKSTVTETNGLRGASISPWHLDLDNYGMLYDDTNYIKIPGYLSCPRTDSNGNVTLFLLNKTAYWTSGTGVVAREWVNWSNGGDAVAGHNQQWNITVSMPGYLTNYTSIWSGTNATIDLDVVGPGTERANQTIRTYRTATTNNANLSSRFNYTDTVYVNGTITFDSDQVNVNVNVSLHDQDDTWITDLLPTTTQSFSAGIMMNLTEIATGILTWTPTAEGQHYVKLNTWLTGNVYNFNTTEDFLISNVTPACNVTLRTYNETETINITSRFDTGNIAWINGTIEIDNNLTDVNINITVRNLAGTVMNWTLNTTWNFTADIQYNLTEIANRTMNFTAPAAGQYYVQMDMWLLGILECFNITEDFLVANVVTVTTTIPTGGGGGAIYPDVPTADESQLDIFFGQAGIYISKNIAQLIVISALIITGILVIVMYNRKRKRGG